LKIIEPYVTWLRPSDGIEELRHIEKIARCSHRSEDSQSEASWERFLESVLIARGDWSVAEHSSAIILFRVDRGITHELVRHRLFSFTQESTRFVRYDGSKRDLEFIRPVDLIDPTGYWQETIEQCAYAYESLLEAHVRPQEARSVLPNALASTIIVTGNFRNWRHFLLMRTTKETHPDMRRVTIPLLAEFKARIPLLYDDIEPYARQIDNLRKPR
jgi:thymidylate synthase (FAD)